MLKSDKRKIIQTSCGGSELCQQAVNVCINQGLLPLKLKGFQLATTLQNPYYSLLPKSGVSIRKYPKDSIGLQYVKKAESLMGIKSSKGRIVVDMNSHIGDGDVPTAFEVKKAMYTVFSIFKNRPKSKFQQTADYCKKLVRGSIENLKRKVHLLTLASINEPFFEYLGHIRDRQFIKKR